MKNEQVEKERSSGNTPNSGTIKKEDVPRNPDHKIDQDFPGYPHNPSRYDVVNPGTREDKETADVHEKDGEKRDYYSDKEKQKDGIADDDGSGNAFDGTERVKE